MIEANDLQDDGAVYKHGGVGHDLDAIADVEITPRIAAVDNAVKLVQRVGAVVFGVVGIEVIVIRGDPAWHRRMDVSGHDVHIADNVRRVLLPAAPDVAAHRLQIRAAVGAAPVRGHLVGLACDGRSVVVAETDGVAPGILGVYCRNDRVLRDVVQALVPAVKAPGFLYGRVSCGRGDQPRRDGIQHRAAALAGLNDQRCAVIVLEGHGILGQLLAVGKADVRELGDDIVVFGAPDAREIDLARQNAVHHVIAVIVDAVGVVQQDQGVIGREVHRPVDIQQPHPGQIHRRAGDGVAVDQRAVLDHQGRQRGHALHHEALQLSQPPHIQRGDAVQRHIPQPPVGGKADARDAGPLGIQGLQVDVGPEIEGAPGVHQAAQI